MPDTGTGRGLSVRDVARLYRVSPERVRTWIRRGELAALNTADPLHDRPRLVVTPDALERFERARQAAARPAPKPQRRKRRTFAVDYFPDAPGEGGAA
jgi:transposase